MPEVEREPAPLAPGPPAPPFTVGSWTLSGFSLGGVETVVYLPELRLAFDVGRGPQSILRCEHLALTHTHMDHAGGVAYLLALRQLYGMAPPTLYLPAQMADAFEGLLRAWEKVQRYPLLCPIVPVEPGDRHPIAQGVYLEPFRTYHPIPSMGYTVVREKKKLKAELLGTPGARIAELRKAGVVIDEVLREPLLSVTGDTLVEVLDKQPHILDSETLVLECTFLDDRKALVDARAGGHIHLSELLPRARLFRNQRLVLSHTSQIYSPDDVATLLAPFAAELTPRLFSFPTEPGRPVLEVARVQ